mmetsp:Transcript_103227/g.291493  ORF Transcript_103227/g.291493 Transcript_103227/m.291493 type:complete len:257 (-) Transcript_103227:150-920(-)
MAFVTQWARCPIHARGPRRRACLPAAPERPSQDLVQQPVGLVPGQILAQEQAWVLYAVAEDVSIDGLVAARVEQAAAVAWSELLARRQLTAGTRTWNELWAGPLCAAARHLAPRSAAAAYARRCLHPRRCLRRGLPRGGGRSARRSHCCYREEGRSHWRDLELRTNLALGRSPGAVGASRLFSTRLAWAQCRGAQPASRQCRRRRVATTLQHESARQLGGWAMAMPTTTSLRWAADTLRAPPSAALYRHFLRAEGQ